jgi:exodeoxyribonuclease V beta subunit
MARAETSDMHRHFFHVLQQHTSVDDFYSSYRKLITDKYLAFPQNVESLEELFQRESKLVSLWKQLQDMANDNTLSELRAIQRNDSGCLHGGLFKPEKETERMEYLDQFLSDEQIIFTKNFDKSFKYFTRSYVEEKLNSKYRWADLTISDGTTSFLEAVDLFKERFDEIQSMRIAFTQRAIEDLRAQFFDTMDEREELSYDELLLQAETLVHHPQAGAQIREAYPIALIDEFQDTDPVQWSIFNQIYRPEAADQTLMYLIGDPKQSIYRFRGADIFSYLEAKQTVLEKNRFTLSTNYRSDLAYIQAQNQLWSEQDNPFWSDNIAYQTIQANFGNRSPLGESMAPLNWVMDPATEVDLNKGQAQARAARITAQHIARTLHTADQLHLSPEDPHGVHAGDIAVLCNRHEEADLVKKELSRQGIDSVTLSKKSVYDTTEARDLHWVLEVTAQPGNARLLRRALSTELLGEAPLIAQLRQQDEPDAPLMETWENWLQKVQEWHQRWRDDGLVAMLRTIIEGQDCIERLVALDDGRRRVTNLWHLVELLQEVAQERPGEINHLLKHLKHKRNSEQRDSGNYEEEQLRLDSDRDLVNIITAHSSKGLEFKLVYTPFLWFGINASDMKPPYTIHPKDLQQKVVDLDGEQFEASALASFSEEFQDKIRLTYVSLTRAEFHHIIVQVPFQGTYDENGRTYYSPLDFVLFGKARYEQALAEQDKLADAVEVTDSAWITYEEMNQRVGELVRRSGGTMALEEWADVGTRFARDPNVEQDGHQSSITCKKLERPQQLNSQWGLRSYSALKRGGSHSEETDRYDLSSESTDLPQRSTPDQNIFTMPRGAQIGLCWHTIFEEITFSDPSTYEPVIREQLEHHGFDTEWTPILLDNMQTVMEKSLSSSNDLQLQALPDAQIRREMEFHFQYEQADLAEIVRLIRGESMDLASNPVPPGFMNGFIDLTFAWQGRYYILDYKSNHLGNHYEEYDQDRLTEEMQASMYDVQYHLYTLALHRYLQARLGPSYDYDKQLGGVYYLFMRGIQPGDEDTGIFVDRPDLATIQALNDYLNREHTYAD